MRDTRSLTLAVAAPPFAKILGAIVPEAVGRLVGGQRESIPLEQPTATAAKLKLVAQGVLQADCGSSPGATHGTAAHP